MKDPKISAPKTRNYYRPTLLGGVVVTPDFRRRGIGSALTRARVEWIWSQSSRVYYFANEHNTASIRMHETLGFRSVGRFAEIRGVTADDGRSELVPFPINDRPFGTLRFESRYHQGVPRRSMSPLGHSLASRVEEQMSVGPP